MRVFVTMLTVHVSQLTAMEGLVNLLVHGLLHNEAERLVVAAVVLVAFEGALVVLIGRLFYLDAAPHLTGVEAVLTLFSVPVFSVRPVVRVGVVERVVHGVLVVVDRLDVVLVVKAVVQLVVRLVVCLVSDVLGSFVETLLTVQG